MKFEKRMEFVKIIKGYQQKGFDVPIAFTGVEQIGKSTGANQIMRDLYGKIDLEKNIAYKITEVNEKIKELPMYGGLNLDEMIRAGWKRDWYNPYNKELIRTFNQIGMKKGVFSFNVPRFRELDEYYRNQRVKFWVHVIRKEMNGDKPRLFYAVVFEKDYNPFIQDPWYLKECERILRDTRRYTKMGLFDDVDKLVRMFSKLPTYLDCITYPPLPDNIWNKYYELSSTRKMETDGTELNVKQGWLKLLNYMVDEVGLTHKKVGEITGWSRGWITQLTNVRGK